MNQEPEHAAQLEELLRIAREKGLEEATAAAKKLNNPHILDDLHDRLAAQVRQKEKKDAAPQSPQ